MNDDIRVDFLLETVGSTIDLSKPIPYERCSFSLNVSFIKTISDKETTPLEVALFFDREQMVNCFMFQHAVIIRDKTIALAKDSEQKELLKVLAKSFELTELLIRHKKDVREYVAYYNNKAIIRNAKLELATPETLKAIFESQHAEKPLKSRRL